jgi:hypothetical protein
MKEVDWAQVLDGRSKCGLSMPSRSSFEWLQTQQGGDFVIYSDRLSVRLESPIRVVP